MKFITNLIKSILAVTLSCAVIIVLMPFAIFEASSGKETVLHRWANKCKKKTIATINVLKKFLNAIKQPFAKLKAKLEEPTKEEQNWLNLMNELQKEVQKQEQEKAVFERKLKEALYKALTIYIDEHTRH